MNLPKVNEYDYINFWERNKNTAIEFWRLVSPFTVAALYRRRWRLEEAFCTVKRLLGISYLWTGSRG